MQTTRLSTAESGSSGFTLIELVVVIGIVSVMAAALIPYLIRPQAQARVNETVKEMTVLQEAILGNPAAGDYGYVGTMGHLPQAVDGRLVTLVQQNAGTINQPDPGFAGLVDTPHQFGWGGVAVGWNGPYIRKVSPSPLLDGWGMPYAIVTHATEPWRYRVVSGGPDKNILTEDDNIQYPSSESWYVMSGQVRLHLQYMSADGHLATVPDNWLDHGVLGGPVQIRYPRDGLQCSLDLGGDPADPANPCNTECDIVAGSCLLTERSNPLMAPQRIPFGLHSVRVVLDPLTSGCTVGVNCEHYVNVEVAAPVVNAQVRIPNPMPVQVPISRFACATPATGNATSSPLALCTSGPVELTLGESEERVVQIQISGQWRPMGDPGDACELRLERQFVAGGGSPTTVVETLLRAYLPPEVGDPSTPEILPPSAMTVSFTDGITDDGLYTYVPMVQATGSAGASCEVETLSITGFSYVQRP